MKKKMMQNGLFACALLIAAPALMSDNPQDPPKKKEEKHISIVKVDEDGNTTKIDTIIQGNDVFVWNGDTIGGKDHFSWEFEKHIPNVDSILGKIDFDFSFSNEDGENKVFMFKHGPDGKHHFVMPDLPAPPHAPLPPHVAIRHLKSNDNVIDLNDPDIISFDKKKMRDGREKITIVRKAAPEE